jgi:hypothetical protein
MHGEDKEVDNRSALIHALALTLLLGAAGCGEKSSRPKVSADGGVMQTRFPGQVTAGGGTSGEVLSRAGKAASGDYAGGTPGIAGGAGGTTGGAATGGTVQESGRGPAGSIPPPAGQAPGSRQ